MAGERGQKRALLTFSAFTASGVLIILALQILAVAFIAANWQRIEGTLFGLENAVGVVSNTESVIESAISNINWNETSLFQQITQQQELILKRLDALIPD